MTCRVLKLARQPYYRWLTCPVTRADLTQAYRANALFDAHTDDPGFGYRYCRDEAAEVGETMSARTAWVLCSANAWWSTFGKKRARRPRPGPPVHDDLLAVQNGKGRIRHDFTTAEQVNTVWLTDITEHATSEGKFYLCAIKDAFSGRIVGYSIDSRMASKLAVTALNSAVARRVTQGVDVAGCVVHSDRGSQFRSRRYVHALARHDLLGSMGRVGACGDNAAMESFFALLQNERPGPTPLGHSRAPTDRDRYLDRDDLPPPTATGPPRPIDAHRIRDHHDHTSRPGCVTTTVPIRAAVPGQPRCRYPLLPRCC